MILSNQLQAYLDGHTSAEQEVLKQLDRETHLKVLQPNMLSGHYQGILLEMFSTMLQPKTIVEIGTYTGYSAICLHKGLQEGGTLHTIDINEETLPMASEYFKKAQVDQSVTVRKGNALEIIPTIDGPYDLVFIDADKENYGRYFDLVVDKLRPGGIILADNVLWKGKVLNEPQDNKTKALDAFNNKVQNDSRVKNILLPVRDGLMLIERL